MEKTIDFTKPWIVCSALSFSDGLVVTGRRHSDCYATIEKLNPDFYKTLTRENHVQGFIDSFGDFHTRASAFVIAEATDQILFGKGTHDDSIDPILISENLFIDKEYVG